MSASQAGNVSGRKPSEPVERRLVAEWVTANYAGANQMFNLRLGAGNPTLEQSGMDPSVWALTVGVFRRYADCVVELPDRFVLIEGKIVAGPVALGELELYKELLPATPELMGLSGKGVELLLLCAVEDPAVSLLADRKGINVVVWKPAWVDEYLATRAARMARAKRLDGALAS